MSRILLIEPDRQLAKTVAGLFEHQSHTVKLAATAQAAITAVDEDYPDIIILELQLSVHNGIEFLYELRSYADWQDIPVIVYSQVPPTIKAISPQLWDRLGIVAYHYKPIAKLADLSNSVDNVLVKAI